MLPINRKHRRVVREHGGAENRQLRVPAVCLNKHLTQTECVCRRQTHTHTHVNTLTTCSFHQNIISVATSRNRNTHEIKAIEAV